MTYPQTKRPGPLSGRKIRMMQHPGGFFLAPVPAVVRMPPIPLCTGCDHRHDPSELCPGPTTKMNSADMHPGHAAVVVDRRVGL